jgi:hypothetical protein
MAKMSSRYILYLNQYYVIDKKLHILFFKLQVENLLLGATNNRDHEQIWRGAPNIEIKW